MLHEAVVHYKNNRQFRIEGSTLAGERFFTEEESMAELLSHMPEDDRHRYLKYGHRQIEGAFVGRVFIIYKPEGLTFSKAHRPPTVLTTVNIVDFMVDPREGARVIVEDMTTSERQTITYVPKKLFGYQVYVSVPPQLTLRWDARSASEDRVWRTLSFALLIKTKNKADFYSKGNHYIQTPNGFRRLYPDVTGEGKFVF